jgi:hypothetical protein
MSFDQNPAKSATSGNREVPKAQEEEFKETEPVEKISRDP